MVSLFFIGSIRQSGRTNSIRLCAQNLFPDLPLLLNRLDLLSLPGCRHLTTSSSPSGTFLQRVSGDVCGSTEFFDPCNSDVSDLSLRREFEQDLELEGALPLSSPRMREHEDQLFDYRRQAAQNSHQSFSRRARAMTQSSGTTKAFPMTEHIPSEHTSRSIVGHFKHALRKEPLTPPLTATASSEWASTSRHSNSVVAALGPAPGPFEERVLAFHTSYSQVCHHHSQLIPFSSPTAWFLLVFRKSPILDQQLMNGDVDAFFSLPLPFLLF